jgi:hypothetical protein
MSSQLHGTTDSNKTDMDNSINSGFITFNNIIISIWLQSYGISLAIQLQTSNTVDFF